MTDEMAPGTSSLLVENKRYSDVSKMKLFMSSKNIKNLFPIYYIVRNFSKQQYRSSVVVHMTSLKDFNC